MGRIVTTVNIQNLASEGKSKRIDILVDSCGELTLAAGLLGSKD